MEIEAKFSVPDLPIFHRLRATDRLCHFVLSASQVKRVRDVYLDTQDRQILEAGYVCRSRQQDGATLITVKQLASPEGAIHRREELEVGMPSFRPPIHWPDSPARELVLELIDGAPLAPLFELEQVRIVRQVFQDDLAIAELSLDGVHLSADGRELSFFEVETELAEHGTEVELVELVECLRDEWKLLPESRSKFERALAFLEGDAAQRETPKPMSPQSEQIVQPLPLRDLFQGYGVDTRHARTTAEHALELFDHLLLIHGLPLQRRPLLEVAALVHNVGLVTNPRRHHIAGRDILLAHPPAGLNEYERLMIAVTTFLHRKRISPQKLRKLNNTFFADLSEPLRAETLALAALVRMADGLDYSQTSSSRVGQVRHYAGGVEIEILGPHATTDAERAQEKSDLWSLLFDTDIQFKTPHTADTESMMPTPATPEITLQASLKESNSPYASPTVTEPLALPEVTEKPPKDPGLAPDDSMAEAARKTLKLHFLRMLYHEPGTRLGEDIEELHDMRVATRRMRAAFDVFGAYLDDKQLTHILKGLRRTGRTLGAVRDLDVFWEKTQGYLDNLPPDQAVDLEPLRKAWEAERQAARERMLAYLDSQRYARFKEQFNEFLQTPGAGALPIISKGGEPRPHRLRHVAPMVVYQRLAAVWAYDEWVSHLDVRLDHLHQLRIAAKGLRYTLEFFQQVLAPEAQTLVDEIKALQDHLGDLQDAVVASNLLRDFLTWGTWGHSSTKGKKAPEPVADMVAPGVATYLAARQTELQHLLDTFPQAWARFYGPQFSQLLASALVPLYTQDTHLVTPPSEGDELMTQEPKYIVLLGPPASGKGTQAAQLQETLDLPHVASGDLFRENLKHETELGLQAKAYMDRGELVPDDITIAMVMDRLSRSDCADGAILDGFPRTMAQAEALDEALTAQGHKINVVLYIKVPEEVLVERVSGRRLCPVCGEAYHVRFNPPQQPGICDKDGAELYQRDDDKPETVRKRLQVYWEQTSPLIDYYRKQGLLVEIDGDQPIETVHEDLRAAVSDAIPGKLQ
jgi:adenylate kinase